jgi:putative tryptophan/tyrosine transport system substrate-binding protein
MSVRRRDVIGLLGGAALAWPLTARAQQPVMPVIGFLNGGSPNVFAQYVIAFHLGLKESGFVEHRNIGVDYRWAEGQFDLLPALTADLVHRQVAAIAAFGPPAALAAKAATSTIPIVFGHGADPVKLGLVASLNRPGGNITGVSFFINTLGAKELGFMHELVPQATAIALLVNPSNADTQTQVANAQDAARSLGLELHVLNASTESDLDAAFKTLAELRAGALLIGASTFFSSHRDHVIALAARHSMPTAFNNRLYVEAGGLMSYAPNVADAYRQAGIYTGRILKGEKPADLPVVQSTKFELVINLKTAKALGLKIPSTLLALADEVIE